MSKWWHPRWHVPRHLSTANGYPSHPFSYFPSSEVHISCKTLNPWRMINISWFFSLELESLSYHMETPSVLSYISVHSSLSLRKHTAMWNNGTFSFSHTQARPKDYPEALLEGDAPISFHKYWMINPREAYDFYLRSSSHGSKAHSDDQHVTDSLLDGGTPKILNKEEL